MTRPIVSPKQASDIVLVPNREILQRFVAERLADRTEADVILAPPVFTLSEWVEETAVRFRQLSGMEVPRGQNAVTGLLDWSRSGREEVSGAFSWSVARQASAADRLLRHWQDDDDTQWVTQELYERRRRVHAAMEATCTFSAEDWLGDLAQRLEAPEDLPVALPRTVTLTGFVELTPLECRLFDVLEARGTKVRRHKPETGGSDVRVVGFETPEDEWNAAARWAKHRVDAGAGSVCIVVPASVTASGAAARRLRQALCAVFHPDVAERFDDSVDCAFFIPAGGRLAACPAIQDAFALMRLAGDGAKRPQAFPLISQWLLSPYWDAVGEECEPRARLELRLRARGLFRLSPVEVVRLARVEELSDALPCLRERVRELEPLQAGSPPAEWLHTALRHWGWPGPAGGAALALQTERLHGLLEGMRGLSLSTDGEARGLLRALCEDTMVPFGGGLLSPVQVLTPEVAAAGHFDAVWVCHADDVNWPPPISVNPYVPARARQAISHMNPEGLYRYYEALTNMLSASAPEVRISWSRDAGQGPRNVSGLLADWATDALPEKSPQVPASVRAKAASLETLDDPAGLPFPAGRDVELPGGADFFRLQAACPLMAYVRYRLSTEFPPMPDPLPDPAFRGILLHRALRLLYEGGGDARGVPDVEAVPAAVQSVLSDRQVRSRLTATGLRAEEGRLCRALVSWLELDGSRDGFTVDALEAPHALRFGRALVRTRFDRIDRLDDGRVFLIDYKSGKSQKARALKWLRDRIQEVQLPLYAVGCAAAGLGQPGGLALASVRPGDCGLVGLSDHEASAAGDVGIVGRSRGKVRNLGWADLLEHWEEQAGMLSEEILAGLAENRVYDRDVLRYGGLSLVLRHEDSAELAEDEGAHAG